MPRKRRLLPWLDTIGDVYYAFWYNEQKRRTDRLSLHTSDPDKAASAFASFLNNRNKIIKPDGTAVFTCGDALTHYWDEHVIPKVIDQKRTRSKINNLRAHFNAIPVNDVSIQTARDYTVRRHGGPSAAEFGGAIGGASGDGTIRGELTTLTAALHHCEKWKHIANGSAPFIEKPASPPGKERWLTADEMKTLWEALKSKPLKLRGFVTLAYYTAARRRSIETLTWFQWPEESKRISLNPQGRRQTNKRRPVVPVHQALAALRVELWAAYGSSSYVLGDQAAMWYAVRGLFDDLGFDDATPHTLRHSRATHLLQQGTEPWAVANLLGDSLTTVLKTYGHHCIDYLSGAISDGEDLTAEELMK